MPDTYQFELTRPGGGHDPEDFQLRFFRTSGENCTEISIKWLSETYWVPEISNGMLMSWDTEPIQDGEEVPCTVCVKPKLQKRLSENCGSYPGIEYPVAWKATLEGFDGEVNVRDTFGDCGGRVYLKRESDPINPGSCSLALDRGAIEIDINTHIIATEQDPFSIGAGVYNTPECGDGETYDRCATWRGEKVTGLAYYVTCPPTEGPDLSSSVYIAFFSRMDGDTLHIGLFAEVYSATWSTVTDWVATFDEMTTIDTTDKTDAQVVNEVESWIYQRHELAVCRTREDVSGDPTCTDTAFQLTPTFPQSIYIEPVA